MGSASFAILAVPVLAHAGTLSFISSLFAQTVTVTNAKSFGSNSQTVPLLSAAVNRDPQATGGGDITVVGGSALLPDQGPSGVGAEAVARPGASQISVYIVRPGDTLSEIASMFDVTTGTIVGANDIKKGVITPGQTLIILPINGLRYTVAKGDTLASLANKYQSDAHDIASYNELAEGSSLTVGDTIIIPNGVEPVVVVKKAPAKSSSAKSSSGTSKIKSAGGPAISGYFGWPVNGGVVTQELHGWNGVDIGAPKGTIIYASAGGTVLIAKNNGGWNGGYGNYVVIAHPNGTQTLYAHMTKALVSPGDTVSKGDTIGTIGSTGQSTGNHLHFEVRGAANPFAN